MKRVDDVIDLKVCTYIHFLWWVAVFEEQSFLHQNPALKPPKFVTKVFRYGSKISDTV